jgi:hypothetical protein
LASALLGQFDGFDQSTARPLGKFRYNQVEFYVQDTWKIRPRLTTDYTARIIPHCAGVAVPLEVAPILWQR